VNFEPKNGDITAFVKISKCHSVNILGITVALSVWLTVVMVTEQGKQTPECH
jgi:hypothetical protein